MSDMVKRWEESKKQRVVDARSIPQAKTNFFDKDSEHQEGFTTFQKKGDPTSWTAKALAYFNELRRKVILPANFRPIEEGVSVDRYSPEKPYNVPGSK